MIFYTVFTHESFSLSSVGRSVVFRSVLYRRFHCILSTWEDSTISSCTHNLYIVISLSPHFPIFRFTICQLCWEEPSLRPTMEELLGMLKDPSLCKKKKRRSSLTRQLHVSTLPSSRSQTLPRPAKQEGTQPSTVPPPAKQGLPRAARSQSSVAG